jgi:hypothetical protein
MSFHAGIHRGKWEEIQELRDARDHGFEHQG